MSSPSSAPLASPGRWIARTGALALTLLLLGAAGLEAQQGVITGRVVNGQTLEPLQGVQVFLPDTDLGTLSAEDGSYRVTGVPARRVQVRFRLLGFRTVNRTVQVRAGETTTLNVELPVQAVSLQQLIVTASGQRQQRELGNAVSTIQASDEVARTAPSDFTDLLKDATTGVTVQTGSGSVGTASAIKIRGNSSIGLSTTPIVYVDGARINNTNEVAGNVGGQDFSRLNDLNPEDIESIEVIKGPAAAALYGTEATDGVIRITTKRGTEEGDTQWATRFEQGANWDPTDWWSMAWGTEGGLDLGVLTGVPAAKDTVYVQSLMAGTRFGDAFRVGHLQTYAASVRGGREDFGYFLSGEFENNEGNLQSNGRDAYQARGNFDFDPGEDFDISVSSSFVSGFTFLPENDNNLFGIVGNALGSPWWGPVTRPDPNTGGAPIETCFIHFELARATGQSLQELTNNGFGGFLPPCRAENPFFISTFDKIFERENSEDVNRFIGSATLNHTPTDFFSSRWTIGFDQATTNQRSRVPVDPERPFFGQSEGLINQVDNTARNITLEGNINLDLDLTDRLSSRTTVGGQWINDISEQSEVEGRIFPAGSPAVGNSVETEADDQFVETITVGLFLQQQFAWQDKIFVTPAVRFDDNSAFGENLGIQEFPQVQASYVISDEAWFPSVFDQFRLRFAWGQSGSQPGTNDALALLNAVPVRRGGEDVAGVRAQQPGNPELEPEEGSEFELGFDAGAFDGRLNVEVTYYDETTEDAIVQDPQAPSLGFPGSRFVNVGEITNSGIELGINGTALARENVQWDWGFTLTTNDNEITELAAPIIFADPQRHQEGFEFGSFFAQDVTIGPDGQPQVAAEQTFQGHPTPEWDGSISSTLTLFNRVTLFAQGSYAGGHHIFDATEAFNCGLFGGGGLFGSCVAIFQRNPDGTFTDEALIKQRASAVGSEAPFISEGDFIRLSSASIDFGIPADWLGWIGLGVESASLRLAGQNLGLWTSFPGLDPEQNVAGSDQQVQGQQFIGLPPSRQFTGTLRINF